MTSTKWQLPRVSVFTPFLRRFTDEKTRDIAETKKLFATVTGRHRETKWAGDEAVEIYLRAKVPVLVSSNRTVQAQKYLEKNINWILNNTHYL